MLNDATGFDKIFIATGYTDLRRGIDGLASTIKYQFELDPFQKNILFLFCGKRTDRIKGLVWEGWFPASLQAIKCWWIQLATHERRSIGSYSRTISQADAGIRNRCKTSNRGTDRSSKNNVIVQFVENKISVFYTEKRYKKFF